MNSAAPEFCAVCVKLDLFVDVDVDVNVNVDVVEREFTHVHFRCSEHPLCSIAAESPRTTRVTPFFQFPLTTQQHRQDQPKMILYPVVT